MTTPSKTSKSNTQSRQTNSLVTPIVFADVVAETLTIPLCMKARISKQYPKIIHDPSAERLVASMDYDFDRYEHADMSLIGCAVRANYFDEQCLDHLRQASQKQRPVAILNLGCGLDDRYGRVKTQATFMSPEQWQTQVSFIEVDLPEVMSLRNQYLPAWPNQHHVAGSLLDVGWVSEVVTILHKCFADKKSPVTIVTVIEGVLMYFTEQQIKSLLTIMSDLGELSHYANVASDTNAENANLEKPMAINEIWMVFDTISKFGMKMQKKHDTLSKTRASFKGAIDDNDTISVWNPRYTWIKTDYIMDLSPEKWPLIGKILRHIKIFHHASKIMSYRLRIVQ